MTDDDYRRKMDDKLIGFLSAHQVWMAQDTQWKKDTTAELRAVKARVAALERWRTYLLGIWAAVCGWLGFNVMK